MSIIVRESRGGDRLFQSLEAAGVDTISEEDALRRDMRPVRIGLLNLMPAPAMQSTEIQWLRWISKDVLQVDPVLVRFDDDERARPGASREDMLQDYTPFSEVAEAGLDGLIVTGDNLEIEPHEGWASGVKPIGLDQIRYAKKLNSVIGWARSNVFSTIYSCLGGHYALNHLHGLPREISSKKTFGVYEHTVTSPRHPFTASMNDTIRSPHSRWGFVCPDRLEQAGLEVLAVNEQIGWLAATDTNETGGYDLFIQGHPEYDARDLHSEYERDKAKGQAEPENYYDAYDPNNPVILHNWVTDARSLHANWIKFLYDHFSRSS